LIVYSPSLETGTELAPGIRAESVETLLQESDIVSLHCPLTSNNEKMINAHTLALMKPTSFLINTSRGQLIDEVALCAALEDEKLAGAGIDVLSGEPPFTENPLVDTKNCFITPHIAWATTDARSRLLNITVDNVKAFLDGTLQNIVNPQYTARSPLPS